MRAVITRVSRASLKVDGQHHAEIGRGFLVLLGIKTEDLRDEAKYLAEKCANLRVFEDENEKMNLSLADIKGQMLVVPNFTLYADCARGRRPDFFRAARPEISKPLFDYFLSELERLSVDFKSGVFGTHMEIDHVNDGPVTIIMDTEQMLKK